jgi:hypothetical protein
MYFFSGSSRCPGFKKWLEAHLPSCNDNDDPYHDNTVSAVDPDCAGAPAAAAPERPNFAAAGFAGAGPVDRCAVMACGND